MSCERTVAVVLIVLTVAGCDWLPQDPEVIYLLPENYHGWICVDFEVKSAPPLPREGKAVVVRPGPREIIETSDKVPRFLFSETWVEDGRGRRSQPTAIGIGHTLATTGPNELHQRVCHFVGTIDQHDAAGNPPGFNTGTFAIRPVPASERAALIALVRGDRWSELDAQRRLAWYARNRMQVARRRLRDSLQWTDNVGDEARPV